MSDTAEFFLYECRHCNGKCLMLPEGGSLSRCECDDFGRADWHAVNVTSFTKDPDSHGWKGEFMGTMADLAGATA